MLAPWCETIESEEWVKKESRRESEIGKEDTGLTDLEKAKMLSGAAKSLCIPFAQGAMPEGQMCFTWNGKAATCWCLWGRSY